MHFLVDANVLIDYAQTDPKVLTLVAKHLGPVHVPKDVLDEVDQLGEEACARLGLLIVDGTLAQIMEAGERKSGLSYADWMCLILARDQGWTCVTNDGRLRKACSSEDVPVLWGLQLMKKLVEAGELGADEAVEIAEAMGVTNPWLSGKVIARFRAQMGES